MENVNKLFDNLILLKSLKNDTALANLLGVSPPVISKLRHGATFGDTTRVRILRAFPMITIQELDRQLSPTVPVCTNEQQAA
jgi:DNA-binding transcriptional regulator YdaS (Cro superfamily)